MKKSKLSAIDCVISEAAGKYVMRGAVERTADLRSCGSMEPLRRLLAMGLEGDETADQDISRTMLLELLDPADQENGCPDPSNRMLDAVNNTLKLISDQLQGIQLEVRMLNLRKKALKRRAGILERVAKSLSDYGPGREAA